MNELLSVQEAQEQILANFTARAAEEVPLAKAYHRVLAADIRATSDMPPFTNSCMDGFAVRSRDVKAATEIKSSDVESSAGYSCWSGHARAAQGW